MSDAIFDGCADDITLSPMSLEGFQVRCELLLVSIFSGAALYFLVSMLFP